jgi:HK97 family phage major capsid protein
MTPPQRAQSAYRDGLRRHEARETGSGLEQSTVRMARKFASGGATSAEWARKGNRWWGRNKRFANMEKGSPAYAAAQLWGGYNWFAPIVEALDREKSMNYVKIVEQDETTATVEGWGVVFGGNDLVGDTFTNETKFTLGNTIPDGLPVFYDHTIADVKNQIGEVLAVEIKQDGVWVRAQLDKRADYVEQVLELAEAGALGWSSGSVPHLVRRDGDNVLKSWPLVEFSLTPTPAEPRTVAELKTEPEPTEEAEVANESDVEPVAVEVLTNNETIKTTGESKMEFNEDALIDKMSAKVNAILEDALARPELRGSYIAPDSTTDYAGVKSFGDYLLAIKNKNIDRLQGVYKVQREDIGRDGGFTVPTDFQRNIYEIAGYMSVFAPRATTVTVASNSVTWPTLDQSGTQTDRSNFNGNAVFQWAEEASTLNETTVRFKQNEINLHKIGGYTQASNELLADSAVGLESYLVQVFGRELASQLESAYLSGDGSGKPLGAYNANNPALITVTRNAGSNDVDTADIFAMYERLTPSMRNRAVWIIHPTVWSDIFSLTDGTNYIWTANAGDAPQQRLMGLPVLESEHMASSGTSGDIMLCVPSEYFIFRKSGGMAVAASEHFGFTSDLMTWRVTDRVGGQPMLSSAVTLVDGTTTLSPFVVLS